MGLLDSMVALVTGGGSGIGNAVVDAFVREGAQVAVLEIVPEKVADLERRHGERVLAVCGDATQFADNQRAVEETVRRFGKLTTLICCVGVWDYFASLRDMRPEQFEAAFAEIFSVNVKSFMLSTKAALDALIEAGGSIVYTLSNSAFYPNGGGPLYMASKWAVRGLVVEMAFELAPKVRVNGVAPGGTLTQLRGLQALGQEGMRLSDVPGIEDLMRQGTPLQKAFRPESHAWAYVYLASNQLSPGVTGVVINSDGGLGVRGIAKIAGLL